MTTKNFFFHSFFVLIFLAVQVNAITLKHYLSINTTTDMFYLTDSYGNNINFSRYANYTNTSFPLFININTTETNRIDCGDLMCNPTTNCPEIKIEPTQITIPSCPQTNCSSPELIKETMEGMRNIITPIQGENQALKETNEDYTDYMVIGGIIAIILGILWYFNKDKTATKQTHKPTHFVNDEFNFNQQHIPTELKNFTPLKEQKKYMQEPTRQEKTIDDLEAELHRRKKEQDIDELRKI